MTELPDFVAWLNEQTVECPRHEQPSSKSQVRRLEVQCSCIDFRVPHPIAKAVLRLIELGYVPDSKFIEAVKAAIGGK